MKLLLLPPVWLFLVLHIVSHSIDIVQSEGLDNNASMELHALMIHVGMQWCSDQSYMYSYHAGGKSMHFSSNLGKTLFLVAMLFLTHRTHLIKTRV